MTKRDPAEWIRELAFTAVATDAQPRTSTLIWYDCPPDFDWWGHWCRALEEAEAAAAAGTDLSWVQKGSAEPPPVEAPRRTSLSAKELQCIETFRVSWEPFAPPKDQRDSLWRFDIERHLRECAEQYGIRCTVRLARAAFEAIGEVYDPHHAQRKGDW